MDYETIVQNRDLISVVERLYNSHQLTASASPEEIARFEEGKNLIKALTEKTGEGLQPSTRFEFVVNNNLTITQIMKYIEKLEVQNINDEILHMKGEIFYRSNLKQRAEARNNQSYGAAGGQDSPSRGHWMRASRESDTDVTIETEIISFLNPDKKTIDWEITLTSLKKISEERSYTANNIKAGLMRILQVYAPRLYPIYRDNKNINDIATSLINSQLKLDKRGMYRNQIENMTRKPEEDLTTAMSNLEGLVKLIYTKPEQAQDYNKLMLNGLISFTPDNIAESLKNTIEKDINLGRQSDWRKHFDIVQHIEIQKDIKLTEPLKFGRKIGEKPTQLFVTDVVGKEVQDFYKAPLKKFLKPGILHAHKKLSYNDDYVPPPTPNSVTPKPIKRENYLNVEEIKTELENLPQDKIYHSTPHNNKPKYPYTNGTPIPNKQSYSNVPNPNITLQSPIEHPPRDTMTDSEWTSEDDENVTVQADDNTAYYRPNLDSSEVILRPRNQPQHSLELNNSNTFPVQFKNKQMNNYRKNYAPYPQNTYNPHYNATENKKNRPFHDEYYPRRERSKSADRRRPSRGRDDRERRSVSRQNHDTSYDRYRSTSRRRDSSFPRNRRERYDSQNRQSYYEQRDKSKTRSPYEYSYRETRRRSKTRSPYRSQSSDRGHHRSSSRSPSKYRNDKSYQNRQDYDQYKSYNSNPKYRHRSPSNNRQKSNNYRDYRRGQSNDRQNRQTSRDGRKSRSNSRQTNSEDNRNQHSPHRRSSTNNMTIKEDDSTRENWEQIGDALSSLGSALKNKDRD